MARTAYRLLTNKYVPSYIQAGYTPEEAERIIDYAYEIDEDFRTKKDYIKAAKTEAEHVSKQLLLSKPLDWKVLFDDVTADDYYSDYRYCSKCDTYFWFGEDCDCDY